MKQKTDSQSATVPTVKSQMTGESWAKRVNSRIYRRKIGQFVRLLKTLDPLGRPLSRAHKDIAHYFLDAQVIEDRRQRSPAERLADTARAANADTAPKKSIAY